MPVIQKEIPVAAGASVENALSGSAFEFLRAPSLVSFAVVASATGAFASIQSGADIVAEEFTPIVRTTFPIVPDDFYYSDYGAPGDRLRIPLRNPTGASITFRVVAQITETR
ncbi:MAG TPA: hypothetical protein VFN70_18555 [Burkholderiales bacterium]|nr:hypothetical protein [Burkholderiales bacterium]